MFGKLSQSRLAKFLFATVIVIVWSALWWRTDKVSNFLVMPSPREGSSGFGLFHTYLKTSDNTPASVPAVIVSTHTVSAIVSSISSASVQSPNAERSSTTPKTTTSSSPSRSTGVGQPTNSFNPTLPSTQVSGRQYGSEMVEIVTPSSTKRTTHFKATTAFLTTPKSLQDVQTSVPSLTQDLRDSFPSVTQEVKSTTPVSSKPECEATSELWNQQGVLPCDWQVNTVPCPKYTRAVLKCDETAAKITYETALSNTSLTSVATDDICLKRVTLNLCNDVNLRVPRIVHYIWFGKRKMQFHTFVGILSAVRFLRPCLVLFHGDILPFGPYWNAVLQLVKNIVHVHRKPRDKIFGRPIAYVEHQADVARLEVLLEYGGIYLDTDQYVLRPLNDLRRYHVVIGTEEPGWNCGNGMILSEPKAEFLQLWLANYTSFNKSQWAFHSTVVPYRLALDHLDLVAVSHKFFKPHWKDIEPLFQYKNYTWSDLDAIHLYTRIYSTYFLNGRLDTNDTTIGEITRYILYGNKDACTKLWYKKTVTPGIDNT